MDKIHLYDKILSPMLTEKTTNLSEQNKIVFKVPREANKTNLKKNIEKIITELTQLPINLGITTNGILLDNYVELFKASGVKDVNISLDTLDKKKFEEITRRDYFDRVINNINLYEANGFNVKINNVIIKGVNDNEITDFIAFTKDKNVAIRFIEFMPFDGNKWNNEKVITFNEILSAAEEKYGSENIIKLKSKKNGTAKNFQIKGYKGSFGVISTVSNPFCDSCNRIRLTANGRIKNCLFSSSETNLLTPLRNGEDIKPIIIDGIYHKKQVRGGMTSDKDFFDPEKNANNRTMIAIGG